MKSLFLGLICLLGVSNCKSDSSKPDSNKLLTNQIDELSVAEKIANAHGFQHWMHVNEIKFTFQVDRDTIKGKGRTWIWHPKDDKVKMTTEKTTMEYHRNQMDSTTIATDRAFINDKFWLLVPFQLVWDTSASLSEPAKSAAPISKAELNKITLTYPDQGGYTPGDAYDIYYDDTYIIREWIFRKGNSPEPSLVTTFENHKAYNGIKIATEHKMANGQWNLKFTDIEVVLEE